LIFCVNFTSFQNQTRKLRFWKCDETTKRQSCKSDENRTWGFHKSLNQSPNSKKVTEHHSITGAEPASKVRRGGRFQLCLVERFIAASLL